MAARHHARALMGVRAHSGWAAVAVLGGSAAEPRVLARERIVIADRDIAGSKQPFHTVEEWPLARAQQFLERCERATAALAVTAMRGLVAKLAEREYRITSATVLGNAGRPLPPLQQILASHALLHAAEGEFYRAAVTRAAESCGVTVSRVREKGLLERGAGDLGVTPGELGRRLAALGRGLGPPWTQDEKLAVLAAWLLLAQKPARRAAGRGT